MKHTDIPINTGVFTLSITKDGDMSCGVAWNLNENISQEGIDVVVEFLHGVVVHLQTNLDETRALGRAFQAGADAEISSKDIEFTPDFGGEASPENVVSFNPSKRKH